MTEARFDMLDKKAEEWHKSDSELSLREYLGLSKRATNNFILGIYKGSKQMSCNTNVKRVKLVYCAHCSNMLRDKGLGLLCLYAAELIPGVTYKVVDVKKTKLCVIENKNNDCKQYTPLSMFRSPKVWKALVRRLAVKRYLKEGMFDEGVQRERQELEQARAQADRRPNRRSSRGTKGSGSKAENIRIDGVITGRNDLGAYGRDAELLRGTSDQREDDSRQPERSGDSRGVVATDREERLDGGAVSAEECSTNSASEIDSREDSTASDSVGSD